MKVYLNHIGEEGLDVDGEIAASYMGLAEGDYLYFISPLKIHGHLNRFDGVVLGKFTVQARFSSFCYRSLEKVERDWTERFQLEFPITPDVEVLELDEDLRQEILLHVPMRVLSEAEMKKDADEKENKAQKIEEHQKPGKFEGPKTYRPFEKLKDLDNT